jgi:hypothetical protein
MLTAYEIDGQRFEAVARTLHEQPAPRRPYSTVTWQTVCHQCGKVFTFDRRVRAYSPTQHGLRRCEPCHRGRKGRIPNNPPAVTIPKYRETLPVARAPRIKRHDGPDPLNLSRAKIGRLNAARFKPRTTPPAENEKQAEAPRKAKAARPAGVFSD